MEAKVLLTREQAPKFMKFQFVTFPIKGKLKKRLMKLETEEIINAVIFFGVGWY